MAQEMKDKTLAELGAILSDTHADTADLENAQYELEWRTEMASVVAKGGDHPTYSPPNP